MDGVAGEFEPEGWWGWFIRWSAGLVEAVDCLRPGPPCEVCIRQTSGSLLHATGDVPDAEGAAADLKFGVESPLGIDPQEVFLEEQATPEQFAGVELDLDLAADGEAEVLAQLAPALVPMLVPGLETILALPAEFEFRLIHVAKDGVGGGLVKAGTV